MNDLPLYIDSPLDMYADDSTIHVTGKTIEELESKLNIDLKHLQIWCQKNEIAVNAEKTKVKLVTTYQRETKLQTSEIKVNFNNTMLVNVNFEKLLGVIIDKHLSRKHHIDKTAKALSNSIAFLKGIRKSLPCQSRLTFYKTLYHMGPIITHISYSHSPEDIT